MQSEIIIKDGIFDNKEVYVGSSKNLTQFCDIITQLRQDTKSAIFVFIPDSVIHIYICVVHTHPYRFHRYLHNEYVYYIWNNRGLLFISNFLCM